MIDAENLPARWHQRDRFVVLDTGFAAGHRFLAHWAAWRADPQRCRQLVFIAIEPHPLPLDALTAMHAPVHAATAPPEFAAALVGAWPALTPDLHRLVFDGGQVQLLLAFGEVSAWLPELQAEVDAFCLDSLSNKRDPAASLTPWQPRVYKALARLAAPGATVVAPTAARALQQGLRSAGFQVLGADRADDHGDVTQARYAPAFVPKRPPARRAAMPRSAAERHALVVGAGLAGCAVVAALAEQGWRSTLVDRHAEPAGEASGNPAGVFHGVVHAHDGPHARFNRACALEAERAISRLLAGHRADGPAGPAPFETTAVQPWGAVEGLLRLETGLPGVAAMQALLDTLGLPPRHVQALDAEAASRMAGLPLASPAWFYPGGGWLRPAQLARAWRQAAGASCRFLGGVGVERLRCGGGEWQLWDADGGLIAAAPTLVLANANGAPRLLAELGALPDACPTEAVRGQLSVLGAGQRGSLPSPARPVVGSGYLLPAIDGALVFGATAQPGDDEPATRADDHRHNLARLAMLSPALASAAGLSPEHLRGRTAWRCVSRDRLPLVGAVPAAWLGGEDGGWDQPRFVPRAPGLYMLTALGSRGITVAPLAAQVLASVIAGAPVPLEAGLLDAIDPARFLTRAVRRRVSDAAGGRRRSE